jgi:hypothetical protein
VDDPASHRVSVPRGTQERAEVVNLRLRGCHPLWPAFPDRLASRSTPTVHALQPRCKHRFGLFRVRSPLLAESFLFLGVLRCFSSPGSLSRRSDRVSTRPGFPIRTSSTHSVCTRLVEAYRSVPRPSSALDAQASSVCPYCVSPVRRRSGASGMTSILLMRF